MGKAKILVVRRCAECVYSQRVHDDERCVNSEFSDRWRLLSPTSVMRPGRIPSWCPLPDADEAREEEVSDG